MAVVSLVFVEWQQQGDYRFSPLMLGIPTGWLCPLVPAGEAVTTSLAASSVSSLRLDFVALRRRQVEMQVLTS